MPGHRRIDFYCYGENKAVRSGAAVRGPTVTTLNVCARLFVSVTDLRSGGRSAFRRWGNRTGPAAGWAR